MITAHTISREAEHDKIVREDLLARLRAIHPLGDRADMAMFENQLTSAIRTQVSALEHDMAQKIMREPRAHTKQAMAKALMRLVELAGQPLLRHYNAQRGEAGFNAKGVIIPGAEAREDSLAILCAGLATQRKDKRALPVVTDKPRSDIAFQMRHYDRYWLINPMDGREHDDVSISIAMIEKGKPLVGIVHFPRLNRTYAGIPSEEWALVSVNGHTRKIKSKLRDQFKRVAAASHGARASEMFKSYRDNHDVKRTFAETSAAYGLCRLAQGSFDLFLNPGMTSQASVAAAHAVLIAAGGIILSRQGKPLVYSPGTDVQSAPPFVAASGDNILKRNEIARLVA